MSWEEALGVVDDFDFFDDCARDYEPDAFWDEEVVRFMAADKQARGGEHYWWVVRACGREAKSRLIAYGRCHTYAELDEIRQAYGVASANAVIDSGFRATEVYRFCQKSGWKPFKGDQVPFYTVKMRDPKDGREKPVRRLWRKTKVHPAFGLRGKGRSVHRPLTLYTFAAETVKDSLAEFMRGLVREWWLP